MAAAARSGGAQSVVRGGGTQRVYAVVDLDEESMQVAKPHRAGLMRPVRKKFARATGLHGFFSKKGRS